MPIATPYQEELGAFARRAQSSYLIAGVVTHNKINAKIASLKVGQFAQALRMARLRTTWIVDLLKRGIPINEVVRAAGLSTLDVFRDLLHLVPPWSEADYRMIVSGARECR